MKIDVKFPVTGSVIPKDHGYTLFSAISHLVPFVHGNRSVSILRISGQTVYKNYLSVGSNSKVILRLPLEDVSRLAPLEGASLMLNDFPIQLGTAKIEAFKPHRHLYSSLVIVKLGERKDRPNLEYPEKLLRFQDVVRHQLRERGIQAEAHFGQHPNILTVKEGKVMGWPVWLRPESQADSIKIQETGVGVKQRMGCGNFIHQDA